MANLPPLLTSNLEDGVLKAPSSLSSVLESIRNSSLADAMPSLRSLTKFAFGAAQFAFLAPQNNVALASQASSVSCPVPGVLSCHNTTVQTNTCCFNAPGGQLLQTQFWDTNPVAGPAKSWTIHGLWYAPPLSNLSPSPFLTNKLTPFSSLRPDRCDGSYAANCDPTRAYTNITAILKSFGATTLLNYMTIYWPSNSGTAESFWEHEWGKHGTCISTLEKKCYPSYTAGSEVVDFFNTTVNLFKTLDSYSFLAAASILPSTTQTYTSASILAALQKPRGVSAIIQCASGALDEIWYFYDVQGSVQTGMFVPQNPVGASSNCPAMGVKYLPKA
ncbi:ribonuclease T2-like [Trapelia coarctata]|nr:ribonuclease T2-like [Trapelia coarctata]